MSNAKTPSQNDQRSNVKNPNNEQHDMDRDNRSRQMNPAQGAAGGGKPGQMEGTTPGQSQRAGQREAQNPSQGADQRQQRPGQRGDQEC